MESIMKENMGFEFTYSANEQKEIDAIRKKYLPQEEDKMQTLRKLDRKAEDKGKIISLIIGILGSLVLGVGMCCTLVWGQSVFALGVVVGIIGIGIVSCAYPAYKRVVRKEREKIAPQILALSEELSKM